MTISVSKVDDTMPPGPTLRGLAADQIEVYDASQPRLKNITADYQATTARKLQNSFPRKLDTGIPLMAYLLSSTWYPLEGSHRWMPNWGGDETSMLSEF